jgi:UDP:flavonoid glycosyltransferase YjiC (YdhE family)
MTPSSFPRSGVSTHPRAFIPLFADQWENGVAVEEAGCAIVVGPHLRSVEDLDRSLRAVLASASHCDAATRVADEIAAMPAATAVALEIETLAAR